MATAPRKRAPAAPAPDPNLVAALAALSPEERGFAKHASTIIGAVILALILWAGGQLLNLNNTVTRMSADVSALSKSIDGLQTGQGASAKIIGDLQRSDAAQDARDNAYEADMNRVKERVRMLEGQKPLDLSRPRNAD